MTDNNGKSINAPEANRKKLKLEKPQRPTAARSTPFVDNDALVEAGLKSAPGERRLCDIASQVKADWRNPFYGAQPYIEAMSALESIDSMYGADSGVSIVSYFLANATTWKGPVARAVKEELKKMLKKRCG